MTKGTPDRRRFTRVSIKLECRTGTDPRGVVEIFGQGKNVAFKGLFVVCKERVPVGTACHIKLYLGDERLHPYIEMEGKVVRTDEDGMGIELQDVPASSLDHFKNLILYRSEDPYKVEEEFEHDARKKHRP